MTRRVFTPPGHVDMVVGVTRRGKNPLSHVEMSSQRDEEGFYPPGHVDMVFGVTRRVLPLLATSIMVFGVTRRVLPLLATSIMAFGVTRRVLPLLATSVMWLA